MGAGPGGDLKPLRQLVRHLRGVQISDIQGHDRRPELYSKIPIHFYARNGSNGFIEPPGQDGLVRADCVPTGTLQKRQRCSQAGNTMAVEGPRLQPGGIGLRLCLRVALDAGAAHGKGANLHPRSHTEPAGALGAHQAFVAGEGHHADVLPFHVNGKYPCGLGGIQNEQKPVLLAEVPHPLDVHQIPRQVGAVGAHHCLCIRPQEPLKVLIVDPPLPVCRDEVHRPSLRPQSVQRTQNRVMLQICGDHMVPRPQQAGDGDVQRHGGIGREGHTVRPGTAEESRQRLTDAVDAPGRLQGLRMGAPAAVAVVIHGRGHRLCHTGRLGAGGGGVVQVDHGLMTFPALARASTMAYIFVTPPTASFSARP